MWSADALKRSERSRVKAEAGTITWAEHRRNEQTIRRVQGVRTQNGWRDGECDCCGQKDCRVFHLTLETWYGKLYLDMCQKCGERLASRVDACVEFIMKKNAREH